MLQNIEAGALVVERAQHGEWQSQDYVVRVHLSSSFGCGKSQHDGLITPPREGYESPPEREHTGRKKLRDPQRQLLVATGDVILPRAWHPELLATEQVGKIQCRQIGGGRAEFAGEAGGREGRRGAMSPPRRPRA